MSRRTGLIPSARRETRQLLLELKAQGKTIFLNSHLLSELEMVCDRVAILVQGLVARQGTLNELTEHTMEYRIEVKGSAEAAKEELEELDARIEGSLIRVPVHSAEKVNRAIDVLRQAEVVIESVQPHRLSLEDIFVEIVSKSAPHAAGQAGAIPGGEPAARPSGGSPSS
jgi:ABC-2 type transport system ATP-binding protein